MTTLCEFYFLVGWFIWQIQDWIEFVNYSILFYLKSFKLEGAQYMYRNRLDLNYLLFKVAMDALLQTILMGFHFLSYTFLFVKYWFLRSVRKNGFYEIFSCEKFSLIEIAKFRQNKRPKYLWTCYKKSSIVPQTIAYISNNYWRRNKTMLTNQDKYKRCRFHRFSSKVSASWHRINLERRRQQKKANRNDP